jgi:transposase-like protein
MGARGRPVGPNRAKVVALFAAGRTVADIAREQGVSKQAVSKMLRSAGHTPGGDKARAVAEGRAHFAAVWNAAGTVAEAARALGVTARQASGQATVLRKSGRALKRMTVSRPPGVKRLAVERLYRQGVPPPEIARRVGASPPYVYVVARDLREREGGVAN